MIRIIKKSDLDGLDKLKIPEVFKKYIHNYYSEMLLRFKSNSLENLGSIFVLDSKEMAIASKLEEFLRKNPPYRIVGLSLYERGKPINITHILLFVNGGYAVNIFAEEAHVKDIISNYYRECEVV